MVGPAGLESEALAHEMAAVLLELYQQVLLAFECPARSQPPLSLKKVDGW